MDQLSAQLAQEAARRQQELQDRRGDTPALSSFDRAFQDELATRSSTTSESDDDEERPAPAVISPFGPESNSREDEIFAEVGDGGFSTNEFELVQQLGQLSWVTETQSADPLALGQQKSAQQAAVVAFAARYHSRMAFQDAQVVLLKEYLPGARSLGCNELQLLNHLYSIPERKWQAASAPLSADPPVVPLLGYFLAGQSETSARISNSKSPNEGTLWLVLKWEALQPLSQYPFAQQSGGGLFGNNNGAALRSRCTMVRSIMRGALQALAYCHERGVAHGSLGSGSILLSAFDDRRAGDLIVKLDNFGFARASFACSLTQHSGGSLPCGGPLYPGPRPLDEDHPLMLSQQEDLQALGSVFQELIFSALSTAGPSEITSGAALQRLLTDVFQGRINEFKRYCSQEPDWQDAILLLDEFGSSGWDLIASLAAGEKSAGDLLFNPFICN
eukprot:jgi/Astpho2/5155/Aster-x0666